MNESPQNEMEKSDIQNVSDGNATSGGFPLSLLFLLTAIFAILIASLSPVVEKIRNGNISKSVATAIVAGVVLSVFYATFYGIYTHKRIRGILIGWAAAITVGVLGPPLIFLTAQELGTSITSIVIGSVLLVIFAGLIRASNKA